MSHLEPGRWLRLRHRRVVGRSYSHPFPHRRRQPYSASSPYCFLAAVFAGGHWFARSAGRRLALSGARIPKVLEPGWWCSKGGEWGCRGGDGKEDGRRLGVCCDDCLRLSSPVLSLTTTTTTDNNTLWPPPVRTTHGPNKKMAKTLLARLVSGSLQEKTPRIFITYAQSYNLFFF